MLSPVLIVVLFFSINPTVTAQMSSSSYHVDLEGNGKLEKDFPEKTGIDSKKLNERIDAIAEEAIREMAAPGAVVLVAKSNKIIFEKAYGFHTYSKETPTKVDDVFDLASISKIAATTLAVMRLTEQNKINLNQTIGDYLKEARGTNKEDITLRDVMLHQAGFIPYIPFYRALKPEDHSTDSSSAFPTKVADGYYLRKDYFNDVMWPQMLESAVKPPGKYVYSDISMYVMQKVVEAVTKQPLDVYVKEQFFKPLGMNSTDYNAWKYFPKDRIIPTERDDESFRDTLLQGFVHDQGAAMASGVAGHAGLFSTAGDLAIYGQMLLNRGTYDGVEYFKPETVDLFTSNQALNSRRGLGFDRVDEDRKKEYPSRLASLATFGHTGYTGTAIWIDPESQLIYIFLSNRVHPKVSPKLSALDIRSRILDAVYTGIEEGLPINN